MSEIKLPCLGRQFRLGSLYNYRNHTLLPETLWDENLIQSLTQTNVASADPDTQTIIADTMGDKMNLLGFNPSLKLGLLCELLKDASGPIMKFLKEEPSTKSMAHVYLRYRSVSNEEAIKMSEMKVKKHRSEFSKEATHVVIKIQYGTDGIFGFDCPLKPNENLVDIQTKMKKRIEALQLSISACRSEPKSPGIDVDAEEYECSFYSGDVTPSKVPKTFDDVISVCNEHPLNLDTHKNNRAVPNTVWLCPLSQFITDNENSLVKIVEVSEQLAAKAQKVLEEMDKQNDQVRAMITEHNNILSKFSTLQNQLMKFQSLVRKCSSNYKEHIKEHLPQFHNGKETEAKLLDDIDVSPFEPECISKWISFKLREIKEFSHLILTNLHDIDYTDNVPLPDGEVNITVCFACNVSKKQDKLLDAMGKYLQTKQLPGTCSFSPKSWSENEQSKEILTESFKMFKAYANLNRDHQNVKFVVIESNYEHDSTVATTILITHGETRQFDLPSKPGKLRTIPTSIHNKIQLAWNRPERGNENIHHYKVLYRSKNSDPGHWMSKRTHDSNESFEICNLDTKTDYVFKVIPVIQHAPGITCIESDTVEFAVASVHVGSHDQFDGTELLTCKPGKPKASRVTHNNIDLVWSKPKYGSEHVQMYIVCQRLVEETDDNWKSIKPRTTKPVEQLTITDLEPSKKYVFKVKPFGNTSKLKFKDSEVSEPIETVLTCQPGKPRPSLVTHDSIELIWSKPEYSGDKIEFYIVNYRIINEDQWLPSFTDTAQEKWMVKDLKLDTKYVFKVTPVCSGNIHTVDSDISDPVETKLTCQTSKPKHTKVTHNSVEIMWDEPQHGCEKINSYYVYSRRVDESLDKWTIENHKSRLCRFKVTGLQVNAKYVFRIKPDCADSSIETIESGVSDEIETVPTCQPGKPEATSVIHDTVSIRWEKPEYNHKNVQFYSISHANINQPEKWYKFTTTEDATESTDVKGLEMGMQYVFKVTPVCKNVDYNASESEQSDIIQTKATSKLSKPFASTIEHNEVTLQWKHPQHGQINIQSYDVMISLVDDSPATWNLRETDSQEESFVVTGLLPYTKYCFKVVPVCLTGTAGMESDVSDPVETLPACQPGTPVAVRIYHDSILISWDKPAYQSGQIKNYHVIYNKLDKAASSSNPNSIDSKKTPTAANTFLVPKLAPDSEYTFKVIPALSKSSNTAALISGESDPIRTRVASAPHNIKASKITHDSITVKWSKPKTKVYPIAFYRIFYQALKDTSNEWKTLDTTCPDQKEIVVGSLNPFTRYVFKVCAIFDDDLHIGTESNVTKPFETKPTCKPGVLMPINVTHNSIELQWTPPEHFAQKVLHYTVSYRRVDAHHWNKAEPQTCAKYSLDLTVNDLEVNTKYMFKVEPVCHTTKSKDVITQCSESGEITTKATSKPGKPTPVKTASSITHESIDLVWTVPEHGRHNIIGYTICYRLTKERNEVWQQQETDGLEARMKVAGLSTNTSYIFKVYPRCKSGDGSESETSCSIETRATSEPSKPSAIKVTHNSVVLKWNKPEYGSEGIKYYTVSVFKEDCSDHNHIKTLNTSQSEECITVTDLSAKTKYMFKILPQCEYGHALESNFSDYIETKPSCKPGTPKASNITYNSIRLTWEKPTFALNKVQYYCISYCQPDDPQNKFECCTVGSQEMVTVGNLNYNRKYKFTVSPHCEDQVDTESSFSEIITTKATSKPGKPTASVVRHDSIELKWDKPVFGSELIKAYRISYRLINLEEWIQINTSSTQECTSITGLELGKRYIFKVQPVCIGNEGSASELSNPIATKASSPPGIPKTSNVTHDSLQLEWSAPTCGLENVLSYTVSYIKSDSEWIPWKRVDKPQTSTIINRLETNTAYSFKVTSECERGLTGSDSDPSVNVQTKATSKPGKPCKSSATSDEIQLQWDAPELGDELVKSYIVYYSSKPNSDSENWEKHNTNNRNNCATVSGLNVNTQYVFKVCPECSSGNGSISDKSDKFCTKATSPPGVPEATYIAHDTIHLKWSKPEYGNENVERYVISCSIARGPSEQWNSKSMTTEGAKEFAAAIHLTSGNSYKFKVKSVCRDSLEGMESDWCKPIQTKVTSPPGKPIAASTYITHDTLLLQWTKPQQIKEGSIKYYFVFFKQHNTSGPMVQYKEKATSETITVTQLAPDTPYVFKVVPECEQGTGTESECSDIITTKSSSRPGKPYATLVTHDTIILKWEKPDHGSENIKDYIVTFYSDKKPNTDDREDKQGTKDCHLQINDLEPHTKYYFKVRPEFRAGSAGNYSVLSDCIETKATSQPGKPKVNYNTLTHESLQLQWTDPEYGKKNVMQYTILHCKPGLPNVANWTALKTVSAQSKALVTDLLPGTEYKFKLLPICMEGEGSCSETSDTVKTKSTSAPSNLIAKEVSHNSILLNWIKPTVTSSKIHSYLVHYQASDSQKWFQKNTDGAKETIILDYLNLNTKYDIYILPECETGSGTASNIESFTTKATSRPGKPTASLVSHNKIHLKWTIPECGSENILSYTLKYRSNDIRQWKDLQKCNNPKFKENSCDLEGFQPGNKYFFKLTPQCETGIGTESEISESIETKLTSKPGIPEATSTNHDSLTLRWEQPTYRSDSVKAYTIKCKEDTESAVWKNKQESVFNPEGVTVAGLRPGRRYVFKVIPKVNKDDDGSESDISEPVETKSTSKPGKPKVYGSTTYNSITISWTAPSFSVSNVMTGFTIFYQKENDMNEYWQTCNVRSPTILTQQVQMLEAKTKYIFKVCPVCSSGVGADSDYSDPIETKPSCKPGKPRAIEITHETINLEWAEPEYGTVLSYTVYYQVLHAGGNSVQWKTESTDKNTITIENLLPKTTYQIKVYPQCSENEKLGIDSSEIAVMLTRQIPLAERMKAKSKLKELGTEGHPDIHVVPMETVYTNKHSMIQKCFVGEDDAASNFYSGRVIMLVGATGTGKTTLINGLVNYFLGVEWKHAFRFKMIFEESNKDETKSQTKWITSYTIQQMEESPIEYPLTIVDTPGFGDTEGIERDQRLIDQIRAFFSTRGKNGIDQIHAIGFVTQSGLPRLTQTQKYIFHSIMSVFGNDVKDNIFLMTTFADGQLPPVKKAAEAAGVTYKRYFKFNNSALFAINNASSAIDKMFWEMGEASFKEFFKELSITQPKSLTLTREVLDERQHLEICIEGLQKQIHAGLSKIDTLRQEEEISKKHEAQLHENKDFTYTITVTKQRLVDLEAGKYVTNCLPCNFTCHYPCYIPNDGDKFECFAMDDKRHTLDAKCRVCPGKCDWNVHVNNPYRFELYEVEEEKTSDDLKKRYHDAEGGKLQVEKMIANINKELDEWYKEVLVIIRQTQTSLKRLQDIALKPSPLTDTDYIDLLIKSEKQEAKTGWQKRVESLEKVKQKAKLIGKVAAEGFDPAKAASGKKLYEELLGTTV